MQHSNTDQANTTEITDQTTKDLAPYYDYGNENGTTLESLESNKNQNIPDKTYEYIDESNINKYADYNYVLDYNYEDIDYPNFEYQPYDYGNNKKTIKINEKSIEQDLFQGKNF